MVEATRSYPDSSNCESQDEEFPGSSANSSTFSLEFCLQREKAALEGDQFDSVSLGLSQF